MTKPADEYIPYDIQDGVREAGVNSLPLWYVGRANGHGKTVSGASLGQIVEEAREAAKLGPMKFGKPEDLELPGTKPGEQRD